MVKWWVIDGQQIGLINYQFFVKHLYISLITKSKNKYLCKTLLTFFHLNEPQTQTLELLRFGTIQVELA